MQPTTDTGPWPEIIMRSFFIAGASGGENQQFNGPWNRLLNTMFPADTMFEVGIPPVTSSEPVDSFALLICVQLTPVFMVEIKPPADFYLSSKRQEADEQLRRQLIDLVPDLKIPVLHSVSAFGTKIAFYKYSRDTEPRRITPHPETETDTAPREWWAFDILEEEGANKFRDVVNDVKEMCAQGSF
ncbi:hypothetical protein BDZ89DRAFT_1060853 [Hymenopellis radicata]|nr:hypothetical protein BDZ89DRAFT_1060853 [Hymenopellis radicata]